MRLRVASLLAVCRQAVPTPRAAFAALLVPCPDLAAPAARSWSVPPSASARPVTAQNQDGEGTVCRALPATAQTVRTVCHGSS